MRKTQLRTTLGTIVAIATAMSLIGVAWASSDPGTGAEVADGDVVSTSLVGADDSSTVASIADFSSSTTLDDRDTTDTSLDLSTSDSVDDENDESTSTTLDDDERVTSSTVDDDDDRDDDQGQDDDDSDDDDESTATPADPGTKTFTIAGVGSVTIDVGAGGLTLVGVSAPDWTAQIDQSEADEIEITFRRGEDEAEFEAELSSDGSLSVDIDLEND